MTIILLKTPDEIIGILRNEGRVESMKDLEKKQINADTRNELERTQRNLTLQAKIEKSFRIKYSLYYHSNCFTHFSDYLFNSTV